MKYNIFNIRAMELDQALLELNRFLAGHADCRAWLQPSKPIAGVCVLMADRYSLNGENRVVRGGSWLNHGRNLRSAYRNGDEPSNRNNHVGFRFGEMDVSLDQRDDLSVAW